MLLSLLQGLTLGYRPRSFRVVRLLHALLLLQSASDTVRRSAADSVHAADPRMYILKDSSDGLCLAASGLFELCASAFWSLREHDGVGFQLLNWFDKTQCLRKRRWGNRLVTRATGCTSAGGWVFDASGRVVSLTESGSSSSCIKRDGNKARVGPCSGRTHLELVEVSSPEPRVTASTALTAPAVAAVEPQAVPAVSVTSAVVDRVREPESGRRFPRRLYGGDSGQHEETLLGGGVFTMFHINIYGVTMYIDAAAAAAAPALSAFRGMGAGEMRDAAVWSALIASNDFDKSLVVQLSLPVPTWQVVAAMRDEWDLSQPEQELLSESAARHMHRKCCSIGTELAFTSLRGGADMQMWLNGELVETLHMQGLANSIFRQYLGDFPVSPGLKTTVVDGLAALLNPATPRALPLFPRATAPPPPPPRSPLPRQRGAAAAAAAKTVLSGSASGSGGSSVDVVRGAATAAQPQVFVESTAPVAQYPAGVALFALSCAVAYIYALGYRTGPVAAAAQKRGVPVAVVRA